MESTPEPPPADMATFMFLLLRGCIRKPLWGTIQGLCKATTRLRVKILHVLGIHTYIHTYKNTYTYMYKYAYIHMLCIHFDTYTHIQYTYIYILKMYIHTHDVFAHP